MITRIPAVSMLLLSASTTLFAAEPRKTAVISVDATHPGVSPSMFGIFFQDINFGAECPTSRFRG
ncbi:hypothetical protein [Granulicella aggregans]|uniref:hypothetical protein n=1 Tax=Granulicella aggregans TaxID=474949 RepID=UPI0021E09FE7|nr:hypothetical protein [Granulicella aggregans]